MPSPVLSQPGVGGKKCGDSNGERERTRAGGQAEAEGEGDGRAQELGRWAQKERWILSRRALLLLAFCLLPLKCPDEPARSRSCRFDQLGSKALSFWAKGKPCPWAPV